MKWSLRSHISTIRSSNRFFHDGYVNDKIIAANAKGLGRWKILETNNRGLGIVAESDLPKASRVFRSQRLRQETERNSHSVQIGWNSHIFMDLPARFINHSCDANVGIHDNELGAFDFFALTDIKKGAELTWDYGAAEFDSMSFTECLCGSPLCRGKKIGFKAGFNTIRTQYGTHYAKYLHTWEP